MLHVHIQISTTVGHLAEHVTHDVQGQTYCLWWQGYFGLYSQTVWKQKEKFIDTIQKIDMPFCSYYKSKYDPFYSIVAIGGTDTLQVLIKLKSHK